ncbi:fungal-specific transcription factor domain-containing protein [Xylariales sp. PMI_506]|nr:fungal-specific transcription factor domain-containing protein [Xylariales sp. PMI_506]
MITEPDDEDFFDIELEDEQRTSRPGKVGPKGHMVQLDGRSSKTSSSAHQIQLSAQPVSPSGRLKAETIEWGNRPPAHPEQAAIAGGSVNQHQSVSSEGDISPRLQTPENDQHHAETYRVPYFRYFGPTAIVPGFKQMVVRVQDRRRSSTSALSPSSGGSYPSIFSASQADREYDHLDDIPVYDPHDSSPVHPVILDLVDTFFLHLGCNYPFLRQDKFPKMVQDKRVEPMLVDAVCALAARFSSSPIFNRSRGDKRSKADNGNIFAQRAKAATVDTFPCPSVAAVQACLLMAYERFGADQDSALWMYLGLAIRMSIDLGLHKKDGVKYQGEKDPWYTRLHHGHDHDQTKPGDDSRLSLEEQKELEQERIDTLWAVFILDRVISSGTGRPVTIRDDDFELDFPRATIHANSGWPDPFPNFIQIIHLYGRVSDVLNKIVDAKDLTTQRIEQLIIIEDQLTKFQLKQDPKLRFDATNFQQYVKNGLGTTFILLHFWFHALIIVLHKPTLLAPLIKADQAHELKAHSSELAMSSAKTIADILAFANFIDAKSFIGNPFTSQPIYIAACAFLVESEKTNIPEPLSKTPILSEAATSGGRARGNREGTASVSKAILASAANQNYQACYKALQYMHTYWGGCRYILTALSQKMEGIWDCETYTREEYESTKLPRRPGSFHKLSVKAEHSSPKFPPLAWSLTGTTNSPNSSLTLLFQNPTGNSAVPGSLLSSSSHTAAQPPPASAPTPPGNMIYDPIRQSLPESSQMYPPTYPQANISALRHSVNHGSHTRRLSTVSSVSAQNRAHLHYEDASPENSAGATTSPSAKFQLGFPAQSSNIPHATNAYTQLARSSSGYENHIYQVNPSQTNSLPNLHSAAAADGNVMPTESNNGTFSPSSFTHSGNGIAPSGYSYLGPAGQDMQFITFDNETDIGQHLTSFESSEMMSWIGEYFPTEFDLYNNLGPSMGS